jgi:hypothetical protein
MAQSEVTPPIVAGVCDLADPTTTGLTEVGYNACPIVAALKSLSVTQKRAFLNHA